MSVFDKKINNLAKFEQCADNTSNEKKREAEEMLLAPEPIEPYHGAKPTHKSELESRTVLIVFKNKAQMDLIGEIFDIRASATRADEVYITDISLLDAIARGVKEGRYRIEDNYIVPNFEFEKEAIKPIEEIMAECKEKMQQPQHPNKRKL